MPFRHRVQQQQCSGSSCSGSGSDFSISQQQCGAPAGDSSKWQSAACGEAWGPGANARTISVDGQTQPAYEQSIKNNFQFTQDNYGEAVKAAAADKKPLVVVYGSWEHNNTRGLVNDALPMAKRGAAKDAVLVYVDPTKCQDQALKAEATAQLSGGHNAAMTVVYKLKPGADGTLTKEKTYVWQGDHPSMIPSFNDAISRAKSDTEANRGGFKGEPVAPPVGPQPQPGDGMPPKSETAPPPRPGKEPPPGGPVGPSLEPGGPKKTETPPGAGPGKGPELPPPLVPVANPPGKENPPSPGAQPGARVPDGQALEDQKRNQALLEKRLKSINDPAKKEADAIGMAQRLAEIAKASPAPAEKKDDWTQYVLPGLEILGGAGALYGAKKLYDRWRRPGDGPAEPVKPVEPAKESKVEDNQAKDGDKKKEGDEQAKSDDKKKEGEVTGPPKPGEQTEVPVDAAAAAKLTAERAAADQFAAKLAEEKAKIAPDGVPDLKQQIDLKGEKYSVAGYGAGALVLRNDNPGEIKDGTLQKFDKDKFSEVFVDGEKGRCFRRNDTNKVYRERKLDRSLSEGTEETKLVLAKDLQAAEPTSKVFLKLQAEAATAAAIAKGNPDAPVPTGVNKSLVDPEVVTKFHDRIEGLVTDMKSAPADRGAMMRHVITDFMTERGIDSKAVSADRVEVVVDDSAKGKDAKVEFFTDGGRTPLTRKDGEFINPNLQKIAPENVTAKITVPGELLAGKPHELSGALYAACMDLTNTGETSVADRANMRAYAVKALADKASDAVAAPKTEAGGLNVAALPDAKDRPVAVTIDETGVQYAGATGKITFADAWRKEVEQIQKQLDDEQKKQGEERNDTRIAALKTQLETEQKTLDVLSNPQHEQYKEYTARAQERVNEFKVRESEIAEHEMKGGGARSKTVIVTTLLGLFLAKQAAKE